MKDKYKINKEKKVFWRKQIVQENESFKKKNLLVMILEK